MDSSPSDDPVIRIGTFNAQTIPNWSIVCFVGSNRQYQTRIAKTRCVAEFFSAKRTAFASATAFHCPEEGSNNFFENIVSPINSFDNFQSEHLQRIYASRRDYRETVGAPLPTCIIIENLFCTPVERENTLEIVRSLFYHSLVLNIALLITIEKVTQLPPSLRAQVNYWVLMSEGSPTARFALFRYVCPTHLDEHAFSHLFDVCTRTANHCMVLNTSPILGDERFSSAAMTHDRIFQYEIGLAASETLPGICQRLLGNGVGSVGGGGGVPGLTPGGQNQPILVRGDQRDLPVRLRRRRMMMQQPQRPPQQQLHPLPRVTEPDATIMSISGSNSEDEIVVGSAAMGRVEEQRRRFVEPQQPPFINSSNAPSAPFADLYQLNGRSVCNAAGHESVECVICHVNERNVVFHPCSHVCCCVECARELAAAPTCPRCGEAIARAQRVFT